MKADELMEVAARTYKERNKVYGDSYKRHGSIMKALYPEGVTLETEQDFNRFGVMNMIVSKLCRYSNNFETGGHQDSIHDLGVYSFMLEELDLDIL